MVRPSPDQLEGVAGELEVADDLVVQPFAGGAVESDVLPGPAGRRTRRCGSTAPRSDQTAPRSRGLAPDLDPQRPGHVVGHGVPVEEEPTRVRVEEHEPGQVQREPVVVENPSVQRLAQRRWRPGCPCGAFARTPGRRSSRPGCQHGGPRSGRRLRRRLTSCRRRAAGAGQVEQVLSFGIVERQGAGHRFQHRLGRTGQIAALQPGVVVDADPGEQWRPPRVADP